jgi:hypothetical protein
MRSGTRSDFDIFQQHDRFLMAANEYREGSELSVALNAAAAVIEQSSPAKPIAENQWVSRWLDQLWTLHVETLGW